MSLLPWLKNAFKLERRPPPKYVTEALEAEESLLREVSRLTEQARTHAEEMDQLSNFVRNIRQSGGSQNPSHKKRN